MFKKDFVIAAAHFTGSAIVLESLNFILPPFLSCYYHSLANILLYLILSWYSFSITKRYILNEEISPEGKAVLITGCDTGFGHNLAKRLDAKGFIVFATCLFPSGKGADELKKNCSERLKILHLDVTKDESVEKAVEFVKANLESSELWAIVNNAGIYQGLATELTQIDEFKNSLEVNAIGPIRVTKAFLPLLKKSRGRVVNITSAVGRVSIPHVSPYVVSKYAAVGFSDSLRQELVDWGIRVISIEPELFRTGLTNIRIVSERIEKTFSKLKENEKEDYDEEYKRNLLITQKAFLSFCSPNIQVVVDDLESAVSFVYPDSVYNPRRNFIARIIVFIYIASPFPVRDFFINVAMKICKYKKPRKANNRSSIAVGT